MLVTVAVVATHNLALWVSCGMLLASVFFASSHAFIQSFDFSKNVPRIIIDVQHAHFWDVTAVAALDKVVFKLRKQGSVVEVIGLNAASATIVDRFGEYHKTSTVDDVVLH